MPLEKIRKIGGGLGLNQRLWIDGPLLCVKYRKKYTDKFTQFTKKKILYYFD